MNKPPFITFREPDENGILRYYILQRAFPHNCGVILSQPDPKSIVQSPIPGYNLYVVFDGVLAGNYVHATVDYKLELQNIYNTMAAFFWAERIVLDRKRFEKFKVKTNVPTT